MPEETFINGVTDTVQLRVQGAGTQFEALQTWEQDGTSAPPSADALARVTAAGNLQIGNLDASEDAFLKVRRYDASAGQNASRPKRGLHAFGRVCSVLGDALNWVVHELEVAGEAGINTVQTALRVRVGNHNTGSLSGAELRAGDFEASNQAGTSAATGKYTGLRASASNAPGKQAQKLVGVEAGVSNSGSATVSEATAFEVLPPVNAGSIGALYGLRIPDLTAGGVNVALETGSGLVRLGDHEELKVLAATPAGNPPAAFVKVYLKTVGGKARLLAKDAAGVEYELAGEASGFQVTGADDAVAVLNAAAQNRTPLLVLRKGGKDYWSLFGHSSPDGTGNTGGDLSIARYDNAGAWLSNPLTIVRSTGVVWLDQGLGLSSGASLQIQASAGAGKVLTSDAAGNATWQTPLPGVPTGMAMAWAGASAPEGWLLCSGQAVSRATYAALFTTIGTTYGTGDGSTTFNVPDLRGRFPLGRDDMGGTPANRVTASQADNLGQGAGAETHTIALDEMPAHSHSVQGSDPNAPSDKPTISAGATGKSASTGSVGGGQAHNNMPPYLTLHYVIKA